jgi:hypothetical protein
MTNFGIWIKQLTERTVERGRDRRSSQQAGRRSFQRHRVPLSLSRSVWKQDCDAVAIAQCWEELDEQDRCEWRRYFSRPAAKQHSHGDYHHIISPCPSPRSGARGARREVRNERDEPLHLG